MRFFETEVISIHAPRTGSDLHGHGWGWAGFISIHAPRTGSDEDFPEKYVILRDISIHAPRTGSDGGGALRMAQGQKFQSTLPARGATVSAAVSKMRV